MLSVLKTGSSSEVRACYLFAAIMRVAFSSILNVQVSVCVHYTSHTTSSPPPTHNNKQQTKPNIQDILGAFKTICNGDKAITADALQALFGPQGEDLAAYMASHMPSAGKRVVKGEGGEGGGEGEEREVEAYDYAAFVAKIFER